MGTVTRGGTVLSVFCDERSFVSAPIPRGTDSLRGTDPNTPALLTAAKKWEKASVALITRSEALFKLSGDDQELRKQALELITQCTQDASVRELMIAEYTAKAVEEQPECADETDELNLHYMSSTNRAINTQTLYTKRFFNPGTYVDPIVEAETRVSAAAEDIRKHVPEGHYYLPARPYPPEHIPWEELVPMTPEPFNRVKRMPPEELVYDEELDEFVVPKGPGPRKMIITNYICQGKKGFIIHGN